MTSITDCSILGPVSLRQNLSSQEQCVATQVRTRTRDRMSDLSSSFASWFVFLCHFGKVVRLFCGLDYLQNGCINNYLLAEVIINCLILINN